MQVVDLFKLLGRAMAKALQDNRLLDLPLSYVFYRCGRSGWSGLACPAMRTNHYLGFVWAMSQVACRARRQFRVPSQAVLSLAWAGAGWLWGSLWTGTMWPASTPTWGPPWAGCGLPTLPTRARGPCWWTACPWTTCASPLCFLVLPPS